MKIDAGPDNTSVAEKLERSRHNALDLTLRNTLLNYRVLKAKGLEIIDEIPREVYRILVQEERVMNFKATGQEDEAGWSLGGQQGAEELHSSMVTRTTSDRDELAMSHVDNKLQTPYSPSRLDARLRNTFRDAHLSLEEQGVNILFLALGMLKWFESESSGLSRLAPLVLVPVELTKANAAAHFTVRWTAEEIDANLSLETKLRGDFGIQLPELPDAEELDLDSYFQDVIGAVSAHGRWSVDQSAVHLGFFSFSKLLIYKDLDSKVWPENRQPPDHPVIRSLYGAEGFGGEPPTIAEDEHLDNHPAVPDTHQVVDSDSSQTIAVIDVKKGHNLVIQGPPGTGKSQTITNLIAEAIADDKRVLFVAEKMAALEVVKRRLDSVHIGDACLELHSHKANKRALLDELKRTMGLGKPQRKDPTGALLLLEDRRDRLNEYVRAVNAPIGESGYSPNQLIGKLDQIGRAGLLAREPSLAIEGSASWSRKEFLQRLYEVHGMQALIADIGIPQEHIYWESGRTRYIPTDREDIQAALRNTQGALQRWRNHVEALYACLDPGSQLGDPDSAYVEMLVATAQRVIEAPPLEDVNHRSAAWVDRAEEIRRIAQEFLELAEIHSTHDALLIPAAWKYDVLDCRWGIAAYGNKRWRFLSGAYRRSRNRLRGLCRENLPASGVEQLALVDAILRYQNLIKRIESSQGLLKELFPKLESGLDPGAYRELGLNVESLLRLHAERAAGVVSRRVFEMLDRKPDLRKLETAVSACEDAAATLWSAFESVGCVLEWRKDRFPEGVALHKRTYMEMKDWLDNAQSHVDSLQDIVSFNQLEKRFGELGLDPLLDVTVSWEDAGSHLVDLFNRACFEAWIKVAFSDRSRLNEFNGATHEESINRFRQLDEELLQHNRAILAQLHYERLPYQQGGGQLGVLNREFEKKRRHLPLRKLMKQAGNAIQQIKPVFMMSPLSIAKFIPPDSVRFDLVVFDEASQVRPVDAMGAILRGEQAVVVGDSKQLPPTSFFDRLDDSDEDDELGTMTADLESILGMFCAQGAPERMLRWHYRSRHESLIAVSNSEFYDNRLVVFPSPDKGREEVGLALERLRLSENFYSPGQGGRVNIGEAQAIARAVMEHARRYPSLTLGVATFSLAQTRKIEDEIEMLRRQDPSCEHFFADHPEEPFFIKNLENVQGDERDVILISVGYGKVKDGRIRMNFGPLNKDGGERRLNVLITRARRRCKVYTNFGADDLDLRHTDAQGVRSLKTFLNYAHTGSLNLPQETGREADSPFEEAVADALRGKGHSVSHQVGSAGFFIDLAVIDPKRPGRYLLGIECDGAKYHSARSARDRDRLRQQVLEGLGWKIHRIWSADWYRNPQRELDKAEETIRRAAVEESGNRLASVSRQSAPLRRADVNENREIDAAAPYKMASPKVLLADQSFHDASIHMALGWIHEVVRVESPVHIDEVALRIANDAGLKRTERVQKRIEFAVEAGLREGNLRRKGDFLWRPDHTPEDVVIRKRDDAPPSLRKPEMIAPEEIGAALAQAVQVSYGIDPDGAVTEASRLFGYKKTGANIRSRFNTVLKGLIKRGVLQNQEGQLSYSAPQRANPAARGERAQSARTPRRARMANPETRGERAVIVYVVDGDTVDVRFEAGNKDRIRLCDIDTPETYAGAEYFGREATVFTRSFSGQTVGIESRGRDKYDRLLAYIWLADGRILNEELARQGFAEYKDYGDPGMHAARIREAAARARAEGVGMWSN